MPELEFIPLSINQQMAASSSFRLNQTSMTSNSNSATSINRGSVLPIEQRVLEATSTGSVISGNESLAIAEDFAEAKHSKTTSRPTSPECISVNVSSSTNNTASSKSNFLNWFSSGNTNKLQQQSIGTSTSVTSGSGNFGMDSNCITSSLSTNITSTKKTTSSTTTGTSTTTINKNSLKSELQSLQDNNNQGSLKTTAKPITFLFCILTTFLIFTYIFFFTYLYLFVFISRL